ncbi:MAG: quinoprotein relay system zinc metallohydrolase 2 [Betaproteobacteria bacterium]|nr:quinoprotein relay system zinc metallohydrolase 2 [Betaproteobacteria bacterium]
MFGKRLPQPAILVLVVLACVCGARARASDDRTAPLTMQEVAAGIYVHTGAHEEPAAANRGDVANIGFIVGKRCVAVIDTGASLAVGQALRAALRAVTPLPVCFVINTHVHPDHILGNAAFRDEHPAFVGHAKLPAAMAAKGPIYQRALAREIGAAAEGSDLIAPGQTVVERSELDLGDRVLELRAWKTAHTDNDLTVFDRTTGTLWLSDLLFAERIPVLDGSIRGWLAAIDELSALPARHVVPGHGSPNLQWPQAMAPQQVYLATLAADIRRALANGQSLARTVETAAGTERGKWLLFDQYNRRNAAAAFAELEWE